MLSMEEAVHMWAQGVYGKSLYLPLNYAVNLKLMLKKKSWASLVAQWLRICLLMQETRVRALVWEDPTCRGAAGPVSHSC